MQRTYKTKIHAAKKFAKLHGFSGNGGGWIYHADAEGVHFGRPIGQGWDTFADWAERHHYIRPEHPHRCNCFDPSNPLAPCTEECKKATREAHLGRYVLKEEAC